MYHGKLHGKHHRRRQHHPPARENPSQGQAQKRRLRTRLCFQLTPNDEEYDESNVSVLLAVPGQKANSMRLLDALIATGFLCTHVRQVPTFDLYMAYEQKAVVTVSGETYLTGPAIVFYCLDDELWDISSGDAGLVRRLFEERTVQLRHGDETIPAIAL